MNLFDTRLCSRRWTKLVYLGIHSEGNKLKAPTLSRDNLEAPTLSRDQKSRIMTELFDDIVSDSVDLSTDKFRERVDAIEALRRKWDLAEISQIEPPSLNHYR